MRPGFFAVIGVMCSCGAPVVSPAHLLPPPDVSAPPYGTATAKPAASPGDCSDSVFGVQLDGVDIPVDAPIVYSAEGSGALYVSQPITSAVAPTHSFRLQFDSNVPANTLVELPRDGLRLEYTLHPASSSKSPGFTVSTPISGGPTNYYYARPAGHVAFTHSGTRVGEFVCLAIDVTFAFIDVESKARKVRVLANLSAAVEKVESQQMTGSL